MTFFPYSWTRADTLYSSSNLGMFLSPHFTERVALWGLRTPSWCSALVLHLTCAKSTWTLKAKCPGPGSSIWAPDPQELMPWLPHLLTLLALSALCFCRGFFQHLSMFVARWESRTFILSDCCVATSQNDLMARACVPFCLP